MSPGPDESTDTNPGQEAPEYRDDLEAMIGDAKRMPFLDNEDHHSSAPDNHDASEDHSGDEIQKGPRKKARKTLTGTAGGRFQCMEKSSASADGENPNARTIQVVRPVSVTANSTVLNSSVLSWQRWRNTTAGRGMNGVR